VSGSSVTTVQGNLALASISASEIHGGKVASSENQELKSSAATRCDVPGKDKIQRADEWEVYTLADAYAPRAPLQFLVTGLLPLPSLSVCYGAPGTLKSMLLADMAICVASGSMWLPSETRSNGNGRETTQEAVIWIDLDNGKRRTHERFAALARSRSLPATAPLYYVSMPTPWPDAGSMKAMEDLARRLKQLKVKLAIIDNLGLIKGNADENSADMVKVMGNLRWLAEQTGTAVIVVHHQRKGNGLIGRAGESLRGHSSIEASLDLALLVDREPRSQDLAIHSTKTRDVDVPPFGARFAFEHKPGTKELAIAQFCGIEIEDGTSDSTLEIAIGEVVTARHPINQSNLMSFDIQNR
jgi:hypothetical protein